MSDRNLRRVIRRVCRHLLGRHTLVVTVAGTVSGFYLWHARCSCSVVWRSAEPTTLDALRTAVRYLGPRDELVVRQLYGTKGNAALWPEAPALRTPARRMWLPQGIRGLGDVVACDGSRRERDRHAGWAVVTDAGWWLAGTEGYDGVTIAGLELLAIAHALHLYPAGHRVTVLSDNAHARVVARRILSHRLRRAVDLPRWVPRAAFAMLRSAAFRGLEWTIAEIRSKTVPLHNIADQVARGRALSLAGLAPALGGGGRG